MPEASAFYDVAMPHPPAWKQAASFAARAHQGDVRKDGCTPYFAHPARVALICAVIFGIKDEAVLTAAYLHDVIEDTGTDHDELCEQFGREVADIVASLSKDMRLPEARREAAYDRQLAAGSWKARLIKLADVYDNFTDAWDDEARHKAVERAHRALKLSARDRQAARARKVIQDLLEAEQ